MKNTKNFPQYSGDESAISVCIDNNGTFKNKSKLVLYDKKCKQYRINNKIKRIEYDKQYYKNNKEKIDKCKKQYYKNNKEKIKLTSKQYYIEHREEAKLQAKQYRKNNKEKCTKYNKQYYKNCPETMRKYRQKTKAKRRGWRTPNPINKYFKNSHLHHLHLNNDHRIAIYIPIDLHKSIWHTYNRPETMVIINKLAFEWLATQDIII